VDNPRHRLAHTSDPCLCWVDDSIKWRRAAGAVRRVSLQKAVGRVIFKAFLIADVSAQYVERVMPTLVGHFKSAGAVARSAGEKAAMQAVAGISSRLESDLAGVFL